MNVMLVPCKSPTESKIGLLSNYLGVRSRALLSLLRDDKTNSHAIVICEPRDADDYRAFDRTIVVPTSYASLKKEIFAG